MSVRPRVSARFEAESNIEAESNLDVLIESSAQSLEIGCGPPRAICQKPGAAFA
jgi:hypothetical protein